MRIFFATEQARRPTERTIFVRATGPHTIDERIDTASIRLPPAFLAELRRLAPRRRRARLIHVLAAALLAVVGALAADRSTRAFALEEGRDFARRAAHRAPAQAPTITAAEAPAPTMSSAPAEIVVPVQEVPPFASAQPPPKPAKKTRRGPRSALRHP
jgi:hypothetical protein